MAYEPKFVYAPFLSLQLRFPGDKRWITSGILEENSEIKITPIYAEKGKVKRFLGCEVELTCYDIEATEDRQKRYLKFMNQEVEALADCDSGGLPINGFEYSIYPNHIPRRGMRWIHYLKGFSRWPGWITFYDKGWKAFEQYRDPDAIGIDFERNQGNLD